MVRNRSPVPIPADGRTQTAAFLRSLFDLADVLHIFRTNAHDRVHAYPVSADSATAHRKPSCISIPPPCTNRLGNSRIVSARTHVPMCARTYTMVEW